MENTKKNYFIGISWFLLSLLTSVLNDVISKYIGGRLSSYEISFFRFFFGALTLTPLLYYYGISSLKSANTKIHILRGSILFISMNAWNYALSISKISTATVMSFSMPIFVLILAVFFLNERVILQRWIATLIGLIGVIITLEPNNQDFDPMSFMFVISTILFASLDIINKKFIIEESMISMLFYSAICTTILSIPMLAFYWQAPTLNELSLLLLLGASSNIMLFFILRAFSLIDATAVAPYRYLELIISSFVGYIIFNEIPTNNAIYGAFILIISTLFIIYSENVYINKRKEVMEQPNN